MKILVIGLSGAAPDLLFTDEHLVNFRRLMEFGCYGQLESIAPQSSVPAWMCMATSQDPGSLGIYGFYNRSNHDYFDLEPADSTSIQEPAIWDQVADKDGKSIIIGVPPAYPPPVVNGISVAGAISPGREQQAFTHPATAQGEIQRIVGEYPMEVRESPTSTEESLIDDVYAASRKQFAVVRHYLQQGEWDFFQVVEHGLDRIQHEFWQYQDPEHPLYEPGNPYQETVRDYYRYLDSELGQILELLDDETAVVVVSDAGTQRLNGRFCINEWLIREGLLVLNQYPTKTTPFNQLDVNWGKTSIWSEGGYYAQLFFNVKGREPNGVVDPATYEAFRDEIRAKFEALESDLGSPSDNHLFKPEEIYQKVSKTAPDLIVHLGGHGWESTGSVGDQALFLQGNDAGSTGCTPSQLGAFILIAPGLPLQGEIEGIHLLDIAPSLLELGGYDIPDSMQGSSLFSGNLPGQGEDDGLSYDEEAILRERLSGLGYI